MKIVVKEQVVCPVCKKRYKKSIKQFWSDKCSKCYERENILAEYAENR